MKVRGGKISIDEAERLMESLKIKKEDIIEVIALIGENCEKEPSSFLVLSKLCHIAVIKKNEEGLTGGVLGVKAKCLYLVQKFDEALTLYEQAREGTKLPDILWKIEAGIASYVYKVKNDLNKAIKYFDQSIYEIEKMRGMQLKDETKTLFLERTVFVYDDMIDTLIKLNRYEQTVSQLHLRLKSGVKMSKTLYFLGHFHQKTVFLTPSVE